MATRREQRIRTFVAVDVPDLQRRAMGEHLDACRRLAPGYRWVAAPSLHLTLRFLGHLAPERLERVGAALGAVRGEPFRIALDGCGTFGPGAQPRVVWIGLSEGAEGCLALAARVEAACQAAAVPPQARPFRAHVTLARARPEAPALPALPAPPALPAWEVAEFLLYESRLGRAGPVYQPIQRFRLGLA